MRRSDGTSPANCACRAHTLHTSKNDATECTGNIQFALVLACIAMNSHDRPWWSVASGPSVALHTPLCADMLTGTAASTGSHVTAGRIYP